MKRKEVLIAVIGGFVGALVTMGVGLFVPVGVVAQSQNQAATFGTITCRMIRVVDNEGEIRAVMSAYEHGGDVSVANNQGNYSASMNADENGNGAVSTWDKDEHHDGFNR